MSQNLKDWREVSLLSFGLRIKAPDLNFYVQLRDYLHNHEHLEHIILVLQEFPQILSDLANTQQDVARWLSKRTFVNDLVEWIAGRENNIVEATAGYVVIPLLTLIHLAQYFEFLEQHQVDHHSLVSHVRRLGGVQGYCGGLPCALAVASAQTEIELRHNVAVSLRLAFVIGILGEVANDHADRIEMMVVRLANPGQGDALVELFPDVVISAITDPKSITVSGSRPSLSSLATHVKGLGMHVHNWPLRGKWHHPDNLEVAQMLSEWCKGRPAYHHHIGMREGMNPRSNHTSDPIPENDFTDQLIFEILAYRSDWHGVLKKIAREMRNTQSLPQYIVDFGVGDSIPLVAFNELSLSVRKFDANTMLRQTLQHRSSRSAIDRKSCSDHMIAIVGASCRLPGASNLAELWSLLSKGEDKHQKLDTHRFNIFESHRARLAESFMKGREFFANLLEDVESFDHTFFSINPREAISMDPQQRIILELAYEAMESCGYTRSHRREHGDQIGCFIGASAVDYHENTSCYPPSAYTATGTIRAFISGKVSHYFGWTGPSEVIDTACSSSLVAIHRACKALESGECSMALAGGVNVMSSPNCFFDLGRAGFLSPSGQCKPFDISADGYCRADGAGLVVLKSLDRAKRDGDAVLGVISASHVNQNGLSSSITVPQIESQVNLFQQVLQRSGIDASSVSYVEAHGTGTQVGDPIELNSLRNLFHMERSSPVHVASIKGNIGHCETAAGVAGLLKVLAMLQHRKIPRQANFEVLNTKIGELDPKKMVIPTKLLDWRTPDRIALINSYGASGANAALVVRNHPQAQAQVTQAYSTTRESLYSQPIMLSAATDTSVALNARALSKYLTEVSDPPSFRDVAFTSNCQRKAFQHRVVVKTNTIESLCKMLVSGNYESYEVDSKQSRVILALSGQNSNTIKVSREMYDRYYRLREHLDECNTILVELGHPPIIPAVFSTEGIQSIVVLHTALVASQIAFSLCWLESGIQVAAVVGHSIGELAALAITGILSVRDCLKLVAYRAELIQNKWGVDSGAMLVVSSTSSRLEQIRNKLPLSTPDQPGIEVACFNSDSSYVLTGPSASIRQFEQSMSSGREEATLQTHRLDVSHGYHSALISPILKDLSEFAESLQWREPKIPLEMCSETGTDARSPYNVSEHARNPVFFHKAIERLESRFGPCIWLEGGMNTPIIPLVRRASSKIDGHRYFSLSSNSATPPTETVSDVVRGLWREGIDICTWVQLEFRDCTTVWLPPYQFEKHNHWLKYVDMVPNNVLSQNTATAAQNSPAPPHKMVEMLTKEQVEHRESATFKINTGCERFQQLLNGHVVCHRAMAPAALYIECAAIAMSLFDPKFLSGDQQYSDIRYHAPLSTGSKQLVMLLLERNEMTNVVRFDMRSKSASTSDSQDVLHATGEITKRGDVPFDVFHRLMANEVHAVRENSSKELLRSGRAYRLFERVVKYDTFFRGMKSISLGTDCATAVVQLPSSQPGIGNINEESIFDAVLIDTFIQPLGLLVNSSDLVEEDEVLVGAGIDRISFSASLELHRTTTLDVFAKVTMSNQTDAIGDVMLYSSKGNLVGMITGCRFSRIATSRLEKILDKARGSTPEVQKAKNLVALPASAYTTSAISQVTSSIPEKTGITERRTSHVNPVSAQQSSQGSNGWSDSTGSSDISPVSSATSQASHTADEASAILYSLLEQYTRAKPSDFEDATMLTDIGIDSLGVMELQMELSDKIDMNIHLSPDSSIGDVKVAMGVTKIVGISPEISIPSRSVASVAPGDSRVLLQVSETFEAHSSCLDTPSADSIPVDLATLFRNNDEHFEDAAREHGFYQYWSKVAPDQDRLVVAYIVEAFLELGVDLDELRPGSRLPTLPVAEKHGKVMERFLGVLEKHQIIEYSQGFHIRGVAGVPPASSSELHARFLVQHPQYRCEAEVMALAGTMLGACLAGRADPMHCLFGSPQAWKCMETLYLNAPLLATATEQLVTFVTKWVKTVEPGNNKPIRILEVGAGTGGTTKRLAKALRELSHPIQYTFSDISPSMLRKARQTFADYDWIEFKVLDLEKEPPSQLMATFDLVIGTNSVHATSDRTSVMKGLRSILKDTGIAIISETTRVMDWFDLVFGLLDGWWFAEGGTAYPLQSSETWIQYLRDAGFKFCMSSQGNSLEATTQELLLASKQDVTPIPATSTPEQSVLSKKIHGRGWNRQTFVYKTVDGVDIDADVYLPLSTPSAPVPVALLIHGGGCVYLSKGAVQASQLTYLLSQGVLPVSLNFRLCPETNILDGAMVDVNDAYRWVQTDLERLIMNRSSALATTNIRINPHRIAIIGYSMGTQLALSLVWTTQEFNFPPPSAVLAFYGPVIFSEKSALKTPANNDLPPRTLPWEEIFQLLPMQPTVQHDIPINNEQWIRSKDPRAELIRAFFHENIGLPILLNHIPCGPAFRSSGMSVSDALTQPTQDRSRAICPLAQLRSNAGSWQTPVYLVHGDQDDMASFEDTVVFYEELKARGVHCDMLVLKNTGHLFDVGVQIGSQKWIDQVEPGLKFLFDQLHKN